MTKTNDASSTQTLAGEAIKVRGGTVAERPQEGVAQDEEGSARLMRGTLCEDFKAAGAQQLLFASIPEESEDEEEDIEEERIGKLGEEETTSTSSFMEGE